MDELVLLKLSLDPGLGVGSNDSIWFLDIFCFYGSTFVEEHLAQIIRHYKDLSICAAGCCANSLGRLFIPDLKKSADLPQESLLELLPAQISARHPLVDRNTYH